MDVYIEAAPVELPPEIVAKVHMLALLAGTTDEQQLLTIIQRGIEAEERRLVPRVDVKLRPLEDVANDSEDETPQPPTTKEGT